MELEQLEAVRGDGLVLTRDLERLGWSSRDLSRTVESGALVQIRRGAYARTEAWATADAAERHRMLIRAVVELHPQHLVLSHHSAAALHRLPSVEPWPRRVHTLTPTALGGSSMPTLLTHRTPADPDTTFVEGLEVTCLERTLVDVAAWGPLPVAVGMLDEALREGRTDEQRLWGALADLRPGRGGRRAAATLAFADGSAGSPGESLSRVQMWRLGFALPRLQEVFEEPGFRAVVDFFWPEQGVIGEFDGYVKYSRERYLQGQAPADVVWAEKRREDALRRVVRRVVRWDWATAASPERLARLLTEAGVPRTTPRRIG